MLATDRCMVTRVSRKQSRKYKYTNEIQIQKKCIQTDMLLLVFLIDEWAVSHQENHKTREYCVEIFLKVTYAYDSLTQKNHHPEKRHENETFSLKHIPG